MYILNALIPALIAGLLTIILGAIIKQFYPPYDWSTILSLSAGVTLGNFLMYLILQKI